MRLGTPSRPIWTLLQSLKEGDRAVYLLFIRFLRAAQRAFIKADSFLRAAGLICGRLPAFFVAGFCIAAGLDPRFRSAHRAFIAADIRRRAAALIVRLRGPFVSPLFGGRPRRRIGQRQVWPVVPLIAHDLLRFETASNDVKGGNGINKAVVILLLQQVAVSTQIMRFLDDLSLDGADSHHWGCQLVSAMPRFKELYCYYSTSVVTEVYGL